MLKIYFIIKITFLCTVRSFCFGVVSTCLHDLMLLGVSCSLFAWVPGCFVARAPLCLSAILLSSLGSRLLHSRLPPSSSFLLEFISFAPPWLCLAISFLQFLSPLVSIRAFRRLPSLATVSSVPVRYSFFLCVCELGRLAWFFQALRLLPWFTFLSLSFSFVTSFPSFKNTKKPVYSYSTNPDRRFFSSTSQHFKMFPPFASSEGHSASGVRYESDGVRYTHPQPHCEFTR